MLKMQKTSYRKQIAESILFSTNKREILLDGKLVEDYFKNSDGLHSLHYTPTIEEEIKNNKSNKLDLIREIIEFNLPFLEKQIIKRVYFDEMKQEGIGKLLDISQEMVSYYKARAEKRIRYYLKTKEIGIQDLEKRLKEIVTSKQLEALMLYFKFHNQNKIAKYCNVTQSAISTRLKLGLKQLKDSAINDPSLKKYYEVFRYLFLYNSLQNSQVRFFDKN